MNVKGNKELRRKSKFWAVFKKNTAGVVGLVCAIIIVLIAIFAPQISRYSPWDNTFATNLAPCAEHWFGTDDLGRDIYARTIYGTRVSIIVGLLASLTSAVIGTIVGAVAGYFGKKLSFVLMKITEFFQIIPPFFLAVLIATLFTPGLLGIVLIIGGLSWPSTARLVRAEFLSLREQEFVTAARSLGCRKISIVFKEILPNAMPQVIVNTSLQAASAILSEATLNFFGLGDPTMVSWGKMLYDAQGLLRISPWASIYPGIAILITVLSMNLLGDGLNDALNPKLRKR